MKCKKCGKKLIREYLGERNKKEGMCSSCLEKEILKERIKLNWPHGVGL